MSYLTHILIVPSWLHVARSAPNFTSAHAAFHNTPRCRHHHTRTSHRQTMKRKIDSVLHLALRYIRIRHPKLASCVPSLKHTQCLYCTSYWLQVRAKGKRCRAQIKHVGAGLDMIIPAKSSPGNEQEKAKAKAKTETNLVCDLGSKSRKESATWKNEWQRSTQK